MKQTSQLNIRNAVWTRRAARHAKSMELRAKETMESMMKTGTSTEEATVATNDPAGKQGVIPPTIAAPSAASNESRNDDGGSSKNTNKRNEESSSAFTKPVQSKGTTAREF